MLTQPFVENAIEHGFKPAGYRGKLTIRFDGAKEYIKATIEDNGIGIERSKRLRARSNAVHQSLATRISEERIQNMNRFNKRKIKMFIEDLADGSSRDEGANHGGGLSLEEMQQVPSGTRITLWIPYSSEAES